MNDIKKYSPTILRVMLGLLFIIPGLMKLMNPSMIIGMLGQLGFPAATFFGWALLLSEIVFGAAVFAGYKVKYTVWPLAVILLVATVVVYIPTIGKDPMALISIMFHALGIVALVSIFLSGAGAFAADKE